MGRSLRPTMEVLYRLSYLGILKCEGNSTLFLLFFQFDALEYLSFFYYDNKP